MTEEPYRWLEAMGHRREYVQEQLKGGSPAFACKLPDGILLLGVGTGNSKVFEIFDRQAFAALGHPADIEKLRQAAIDAAHLEAFARAPEDVTVRRLVSFGLSPQLKTNFEQIFSAPFLIAILLAEVHPNPDSDLLVRLHFDGSFQFQPGPAAAVASDAAAESAAVAWLNAALKNVSLRAEAAELLLQAWWMVSEGKSFTETVPPESERSARWRAASTGKVIELAWLARRGTGQAKYEAITPAQVGL